jgi:hypothetical protein
MMGETGPVIIEQVGIDPLMEPREELKGIEGKRFGPYVEHLLADIVMITVMAGANEWSEIAGFARIKEGWLRRFPVLPHGIPSHDSIQRVMSMTDGNVLYSLCIQLLIRRPDILAATARERRLLRGPAVGEEKEAPKVIATDGETSRGSKRNKTDREAAGATPTVSACSTEGLMPVRSGGR